MAEGRILGFMLGAAEQIGKSYEAFPDAQPPQAETLLFIEATEMEALQAVMENCQGALGGYQSEAGLWRLLQYLERTGLRDPQLHRQLPREELRMRWNTPEESATSGAISRSST